MKITMLHGQDHKGSTYHIGKMLADSIPEESEVVEFFFPRDLNSFCKGCYQCIEDEAKCPFYKEKNAIMQQIEDSDLLVFTSPTYCMAPSAPLKSFMDLTFTYWMSHRPRKRMFQKKAVVISTAAGAGMKQAIKPVRRMLFYWGIPVVKSYGIAVQAMNWDGVSGKKKEKIQKDILKLARKLARKKKIRVPLKTKFIFNMMAGMQKAGMGSGPMERKYWEDKGWLGKERPWKKR